jgi:hypothetical protein
VIAAGSETTQGGRWVGIKARYIEPPLNADRRRCHHK